MSIIKTLPSLNRQNLLLFILPAFCISLLLVRAKLTHSIFFFFLVWNLFLAYLPLAITTLLTTRVHLTKKKIYFYPLLLCWLLMLPNAPYIITDFIHLQRELDVPVWFDVLLLISFAANGLLFGLASMHHIYIMLETKWGSKYAKTAIMAVCLLSAYGIYLGRYLRYNSWDIVHKPLALFNDMVSSVTDPLCLRASLGITLGFGMLLYLLFSLYSDPENK